MKVFINCDFLDVHRETLRTELEYAERLLDELKLYYRLYYGTKLFDGKWYTDTNELMSQLMESIQFRRSLLEDVGEYFRSVNYKIGKLVDDVVQKSKKDS